MRTLGTMIVPARVNELQRVLHDITIDDMQQLDPTIAVGMDRTLGREMLAVRLQLSESVYVCLYNLEPSGLIVLHRTNIAAQIRALAVSPDMRRKGLARTMMIEAEQRAVDRQIGWLWMRMSSSNTAATMCARSFGFRRVNAQYLYRAFGPAIPSNGIHVQLEPLQGAHLIRLVTYWMGVEANVGDKWVQPLIAHELTPLLMPQDGYTWRLLIAGNEVGCAHLAGSHVHLAGTRKHLSVTLWLDESIWNKPEEFACLRTVMNTFADSKPSCSVRVGSAGHLRTSLSAYQQFGFKAILTEDVLFVKRIVPPDE